MGVGVSPRTYAVDVIPAYAGMTKLEMCGSDGNRNKSVKTQRSVV